MNDRAPVRMKVRLVREVEAIIPVEITAAPFENGAYNLDHTTDAGQAYLSAVARHQLSAEGWDIPEEMIVEVADADVEGPS